MSQRRVIAVAASAITLLGPLQARAYNFTTHSRMTELAVRTMSLEDPGTPPSPADAALYQEFLDQLAAAPAKLAILKSGLPTSRPNASLNPVGDDGSESYPFPQKVPKTCPIRDNPDPNKQEHLDLNKAGQIPIHELHYFPQRNASPCGLVPATDNDDGQPENLRVLELVLGWHAGSVDDNFDDTVLWHRPANAAQFGLISEAASLVFELALGSVALPYVCIYEAVFGDGCDIDDSFELARSINVVDYLQGWIPGVGDVRGLLFNGIWHFIDTDAIVNRFNTPRGTWLPEAGPVVFGVPKGPGAVDVAIIAATELSGLSLNAGLADGDNQYGQFDNVHRGAPLWQAHSFGLLEWSSLNNLAKYGWTRYKEQRGTDASGLAWPLHALGDAVQPHHIVGTTAYGHQAYEDFVGHNESLFFRDGPEQTTELAHIRTIAFQHWKLFSNGAHDDIDIDALVRTVAVETRLVIGSRGEWIWRDEASTLAATSKLPGGLEAGARAAELEYEVLIRPFFTDDVRLLLENGAGAILAVLLVAAQQAQVPDRGNIDCPAGTHFFVNQDGIAACQEGPSSTTGPITLADAGVGVVSTPPPQTCDVHCPESGICDEGELCIEGCCVPGSP
jgi:hypothetical protein